jgi:hypothetical protein
VPNFEVYEDTIAAAMIKGIMRCVPRNLETYNKNETQILINLRHFCRNSH